MRDYFNRGKLWFAFPIDGDCLNSRDGRLEGGTLTVPVRLYAEGATAVRVCGRPAVQSGDAFIAQVPIGRGKTVLDAVSDRGDRARITVYRLANAEHGFRLSVDDNILFLRDLSVHSEYRSIFDNPYLAVYREAHEQAGAKVHLNLFYETADLDGFATRKDGFDLTMVPDRFKAEWRRNADWLKLSFHARKENPACPYRDASAAEVRADCHAVHREILRFAGRKSLSKATTIHFGTATEQGVAALRALGYRALAGYFMLDEEGQPLVSYFYPKELLLHVGERDFWHDTALDVTYARIDRVINLSPDPAVNIAALEEAAAHPGRGGFLDFMIHEQYYYPDYCGHIPRFRDIVVGCCQRAAELGYTGRLLEEVIG